MELSNKAARLLTAIAIIGATLYPAAPALADQTRDDQWHLRYLDLTRAHRVTTGSGATVAVTDSGVFPHRDLAKNLKKGADTSSGTGGVSGQTDKVGHGTNMAGLIAGHGHNTGDGALGIAPAAALIPIKVTGARDNGLGLASGIEWATTTGADVINISATAPSSRPLSEAITAAVRADIVVVAGTGNKSENIRLAYPAALPEVLAVGAVDRDGKIAEFSVTGSKVGICAPGVDIVTTGLNNNYDRVDGTSAATAIVSGAAALVRAKFPDLSAEEVIHRLTATADDNGPPGRDDQCGFGVLNVVKALTADVPPLEGDATAPASASAAAPSVAGSATAAPDVKSDESNSVPVIAGAVGGIAALGVLLAFLVRRRRRPTA
ncbi:type VII secretion-associated serine protease mycosin [Actinoplanes sp. NPDC049802]|uniref:type VII secretion-associated serine protease mycosin n=1 Tax=Actinoplanes sp. NPDC049802 TaxID=3154742 RepID=UPI0033FADD71